MSESRNRVLEFLTAQAKPDGDACRSNRRQSSSLVVELAWVEAGHWRSVRARLLDIGRGGAGLVSRQAPPLDARARLRFVDGEGSPWVEAKVIGSDRQSSRGYRVRIRFDEPCPGLLLRQAVLGEDESDPAESDTIRKSVWNLGSAEDAD